MTVGMISALVGLFSDRAVRKQSDIMNVVLGANDLRTDKVDKKRETEKNKLGKPEEPKQPGKVAETPVPVEAKEDPAKKREQ